ncbi:MAG: B12-binding domain-containing radical SAM protein, partial [Rhodospirillaceae bacterium]
DWDITKAYDLIDITNYSRAGSLGPFSRYVGADKPFATVLSNRGCRARCTFCTVRNFNGFGIRQRDVQSVIDEIKYLYDHKGIRNLDWLDDDLLWDPKRTVALFKGLAEQVPGLEWTAQNGLIAVAIDEDIMEWMVKSGLKAFKIGIESGNDEMLHAIKKPTTKAKLRVKRKLFAKYPEVLVSANFIIGFPNEKFSQMMDSFNFGCELQYDWSSFFICQPLKGTDMFSVFQSMGDDRTQDEGYSKLLNPARAAERGEFGYRFGSGENVIRAGWDVFTLPDDVVPNMEQQKEIWFTFNFVCNFLRNHNFKNPTNPEKMVHWFESIHSGYPHDASMAATLVYANKIANNKERVDYYRARFLDLVEGSGYWKSRVEQFPEMLMLADVAKRPAWFTGEMPTSLDRDIEKMRPAGSGQRQAG